MIKIFNILKKVADIGITEDLPYMEKLKVRILNQQNMVTALALIIFSTIDIINKSIDFFVALLILIFAIAPIFYLQYKGKFKFARFMELTIFPLLILLLSCAYGDSLRLEYSYYGLMVMALVFFDRNWLRASFVIFIGFSYCMNLLFFLNFESPYTHFVGTIESFLMYILIMAVIFFILLIFYNESQIQHKKQENISKSLQNRNEELQKLIKKNEKQNEELLTFILQNENKGKLLEILAEDIKEPTQIFNNLTERVSDILKKEDPERIKELAVDIENTGINLAFMLDNLMNWTLAQRNEKVKNLQLIDLSLIVKEVIGQLAYLSNAKSVVIINNINTQIIEWGDRNIMKVIIINILHNAIKFSNLGGTVTIDLDINEKESIISIKDTGIGMDEEYLKAVLSNKLVHKMGTQSEKGQGLGIKSCMKLLEQIEGEMRIKTQKNKGTTVSLFIPKNIDEELI